MTDSGIKSKKWIMISGILVVIAVAAAGLLRGFGCEKAATVTDTVGEVLGDLAPDNAEPAADEPTEPVEAVEAADDTVTLKSEECGDVAFIRSLQKGDRGPQVRALQTWLNCEGESIEVDGIFGTSTAKAVAARLGQPD